MAKRSKKVRRIAVAVEVQLQLVEEFDVTSQTVLLALKFFSYSPLAKQIRKRSLELMDELSKTNRELMDELEEVEA